MRISVNADWHGIEDWFGKFNNRKFEPSKTDVSNFYKDIKENIDKLGILVFDNFNLIPPEIYIESFTKNIDNNGYANIVSPETEVDEGYEFMTIEHLSNLKYFFIKRKDSDTSFEIPLDLQKYELKETD